MAIEQVRSRVVRGAGGKDPASGGGGIPRTAVDLSRTQPPSEPVGALSAGFGSEAGDAGGHLRGAWFGNDRRAHGHTQGRGRLCAARSELSAGTFAVHAGE